MDSKYKPYKQNRKLSWKRQTLKRMLMSHWLGNLQWKPKGWMAVNNFTPLPRNNSCRLGVHMLKIMLKEWSRLRERHNIIWKLQKNTCSERFKEFSLFSLSKIRLKAIKNDYCISTFIRRKYQLQKGSVTKQRTA